MSRCHLERVFGVGRSDNFAYVNIGTGLSALSQMVARQGNNAGESAHGCRPAK